MTARPLTLNESQWKAVSKEDGHLLIVAGPGTGKTHTLIHRIERIKVKLAPGQKILAITFTNKAADEMQERLGTPCPKIGDQVFVGTFHRFCLAYLRRHAEEAGLPSRFAVAGAQDLERLAGQLWPSAGARDRKKKIEEISRWKAGRFGEELPPEVKAYNALLRANGLLDYDDLLLEALALLSRQASHPYAFIFVDEYQDINALQRALLQQLAGPGVFLTAIGDPNQSIYGFRGSEVRFFRNFAEDFPGAETVFLSDNYRSSPNLLQASGQVMSRGSDFLVPPLTAQMYTQGRLMIHGVLSDKAEAEYVVHQIEKMVGGTSLFSRDSGRVGPAAAQAEVGFGDIAVLYRLNAQRKILEEALGRHGIPFEVSGDKPFGQKPPVVEVMACLRSMAKEAAEGTNPPPQDPAGMAEEIERKGAWQNVFKKHPAWEENFQKFKRVCRRCATMEELEDYVALQRPEDALDRQAEKVHLLTLHASKGLEFPVVFITGCEERLVPLDLNGMASDPEEERRLFYVGMTRAKKTLYLTHARSRRIFGALLEQRPCRYLEDIEHQLKEYEQALSHSRSKPRHAEKQLDLF